MDENGTDIVESVETDPLLPLTNEDVTDGLQMYQWQRPIPVVAILSAVLCLLVWVIPFGAEFSDTSHRLLAIFTGYGLIRDTVVPFHETERLARTELSCF
jgi:hypothetical protein